MMESSANKRKIKRKQIICNPYNNKENRGEIQFT